ncbi:hypothetical protein VNI00_000970 [Paramarasmius palmivorus]|uniref:Uncharacterized protein n=1 Tax=Paramarasmius palmivorus TaxID=297713 RepID=A0AAW0E7L3_9AGAR
MIPPSPDETTVLDRILSNAANDTLEPDAAVELFLQSGLTPEVLADVWGLADKESKGYLSREEVMVALRLMGWAQRGVPVKHELSDKCAPIVILSSFNPPAASEKFSPNDYPPLSPSAQAQYQRIFERAGASEGVLSCERVWQLWIKSELPVSTLATIWDLVDKRKEGYLNAAEFCMSMYFIEGLLDNHFTSLPNTIPLHIQNQAFEPLPSVDVQSPKSPLFAHQPIKISDLEAWNFSPSFLDFTKRQFTDLDTAGSGFVTGDALVPFLLQSTLSPHALSLIWDLADPSHTGHLSYQGFTIALFMVYRARCGLDIPNALPLSCNLLLSAVSEETEGTDPEQPEDDEAPTSPFLSVHEPRRRDSSKDPRLSLYENKPPSPPPKDRTPDAPNQGRSSKSPRRTPTTPTVPPKPDEYFHQSPASDNDALHAELRRIKDSLSTMRQENEHLHTALEAAQEFQAQLEEEREESAQASARINYLRKEIHKRDEKMLQLEASCKDNERLGMENATLQARVHELSTKLQNSTAELEVQKLVHHELREESESLRRQAEEMRESMHVPSSGGDEELQMLINEDLARENTRLRRQVQELTESVAQLQSASVELDAQKQIERSLTRENRRLQRRIRDMESGNVETQTQLRRRVEELTTENQRLRQQASHQTAPRVQEESSDVPPPAYEEIAVVS